MPNMQLEKTPVREQDPKVRARNFEEVSACYTDSEALNEANRCLNCKNKPCVSGCPVGVRIPEFISMIRDGDVSAAYDIIKTTNGLPAVCGRVCPQESQCESKCVRGIKGESVESAASSATVPITWLIKRRLLKSLSQTVIRLPS